MMATQDFFIDTESLSQNLGREDLVLIDVRGPAAYTSHIPGAVNSTWHEYSDPSAVSKGVLNPDLSQIEQRVRALGINQTSDVVIYSNPFDNWGDEGRMFWMLQYLGHSSVRILDGGWVKWVAEQRRFDHEVVKPATGDFTVNAQPDLMILKDALKKLVKGHHPNTVILDARSVEEYAGKEIDGLPRAGHIPSAINISWNQFLQKMPLSNLRNRCGIFLKTMVCEKPKRSLRIVWAALERLGCIVSFAMWDLTK